MAVITILVQIHLHKDPLKIHQCKANHQIRPVPGLAVESETDGSDDAWGADTGLPPLSKELRNSLDSDSMAASASSSAASASSTGSGGSDAAAAAPTAGASACPCPICLESFKDEAYLDTCFRKSSPSSHKILTDFPLISGVKLASVRYTPIN
jgi:hypothetical protein